MSPPRFFEAETVQRGVDLSCFRLEAVFRGVVFSWLTKESLLSVLHTFDALFRLGNGDVDQMGREGWNGCKFDGLLWAVQLHF